MKTCIIDGCENERLKGRKYCHEHFLQIKREQYKEKRANGTYYRTKYPKKCIWCGKDYEGFTKTSLYCSRKCCKEASRLMASKEKNPYEYDNENYSQSINKHRNLATQILKRKLNTNEVVHHLDLNPKNNDLDNLMVLSRRKHVQLHAFLNKLGALCKELHNLYDENCWKTFIVQATTTWLETTGVKVQKLSEIRQSASEPLLNEEGSETMHVTFRTDEDIVQTTTC